MILGAPCPTLSGRRRGRSRREAAQTGTAYAIEGRPVKYWEDLSGRPGQPGRDLGLTVQARPRAQSRITPIRRKRASLRRRAPTWESERAIRLRRSGARRGFPAQKRTQEGDVIVSSRGSPCCPGTSWPKGSSSARQRPLEVKRGPRRSRSQSSNAVKERGPDGRRSRSAHRNQPAAGFSFVPLESDSAVREGFDRRRGDGPHGVGLTRSWSASSTGRHRRPIHRRHAGRRRVRASRAWHFSRR